MQNFPNGRYWWLSSNPDTFTSWSLLEMKKGKAGECCWSVINNDGHRRATPEAFRDIRKGDWLLGYIGGSAGPRGVYSLLQCSSAVVDDGKDCGPYIRIVKVRDLDRPIPWDVFARDPVLKNSRVVRLHSSGSLFGFTEKEQAALLKLLCGFGRRQYWTYTPGSNARGDWDFDSDIRDGVMGLGQDNLGDLRKYGTNLKKLARDMRKNYRLEGEGDGSGNARYMMQFRDEMKIGDIVFVKRGMGRIAGVGIVTGDYRFDKHREGGQVRAVKWIRHFDKEKELPFKLPRTTLTRLSDPKKIKALLSLAGVTDYELRKNEKLPPMRISSVPVKRKASKKSTSRVKVHLSPREQSARLKMISRTERLRETVQRNGQRELREYLLGKRGRCAVTGLRVQSMLVASHIKDWKMCKRDEKLDEENVLLLARNYDAAFDRKLISFDSLGKIVKSDAVSWQDLAFLGIRKSARISRPHGRRADYLAWHRARLAKE